MSDLVVQVAQIVEATRAEGPGSRLALWVQGCPLCCKGCCNPEMLSVGGGTSMSVEELVKVAERCRQHGEVEGISLLGGEPFAQAPALAELAERVQALGLSVVTFSGYTLSELRARPEESVARLLAATDVLVDGRYDCERPETRRRWVGSENQVIHLLSSRYTEESLQLSESNTIEIRIQGGVMTVNGWPALEQVRRIAR